MFCKNLFNLEKQSLQRSSLHPLFHDTLGNYETTSKEYGSHPISYKANDRLGFGYRITI